jgi:hypothetical protein
VLGGGAEGGKPCRGPRRSRSSARKGHWVWLAEGFARAAVSAAICPLGAGGCGGGWQLRCLQVLDLHPVATRWALLCYVETCRTCVATCCTMRCVQVLDLVADLSARSLHGEFLTQLEGPNATPYTVFRRRPSPYAPLKHALHPAPPISPPPPTCTQRQRNQPSLQRSAAQLHPRTSRSSLHRPFCLTLASSRLDPTDGAGQYSPAVSRCVPRDRLCTLVRVSAGQRQTGKLA